MLEVVQQHLRSVKGDAQRAQIFVHMIAFLRRSKSKKTDGKLIGLVSGKFSLVPIWRHFFQMSYLDINDILAGEERMKCTFQTDALDCAYLDPSCVEDDIKSGTMVELPLWLAEPLTLRGDVTLDPPQFLTKRFRRVMKAGPSSVNLRDFSPYVYEVAKYVLPLVEEPDAKEIEEILRLAFGGERYREILNNSMNSMEEDTTEFTRKLTEEEKKLFQAGIQDAQDFMQWKGRQRDVIATAGVIERSSKKRRL